jgi:hypothetical protein
MNFILKNKTKILWSIFITLFGLNIISMLFFGTITSGDSIRGIEMMYQYANGASWNTLNYPSVHHLIHSYYVSWWSPSQWFFPYILYKLLNIESIQSIQFILITSTLLISVYGYYALFLKFGFSINITLLSLISMITCEAFYWNFIGYYGGNLFLLGFFPYFTMLLLKIKESTSLKNLLLYAIACCFGLFLKNTFFIVIVCACFYLLAHSSKKDVIQGLKNNLPYVLCAGAILMIVQFYFLNKGDNPGNSNFEGSYLNIKNDLIGDLTYSLGSPIGLFSRFTMISQKLYSTFFYNSSFSNILQIIPLGLTVLFLLKFPRKEYSKYVEILFLFCLPILLIFSYLYLTNKDVSYASRHFAAFAFIFFPGILVWINALKFKKGIYSILIFLTLYDCRVSIISQLVIQNETVLWNSIKVPKTDLEVFKKIKKWDKNCKNGILITEDNWSLNVGINNNDKISIHQEMNTYKVESGIPLKTPDKLILSNSFLKRYKSILIVSPFSQKKLEKILIKEGFTISNKNKVSNKNLIYFEIQSD